MSKRESQRARGLTVVGASAGSGKTHRLTREVLTAVTSGGVPLEGLIAVTYTKRAQVELASRIRRTLLASDDPERAARLPLANVGTVHAACLRIVRELALDAGLSPAVDVLAHDERLVRQIVEQTLPLAMRDELLQLAVRMAILRDMNQNVDWVTPVSDVMTLARHGRIAPAALPAMAARSIETLLDLLPPAAHDDLDAALLAAVDQAQDHVAASACTTAKTREVARTLRAAAQAMRRGPVDWPEWCKLGKLDPGKKARDAVEPVMAVAGRVLEHPRLRADLARFQALVFQAAALTLGAYQAEKADRQVLDYVDMIDEALTLLDDPAIAEDLRARLRLVVVDELQDSSPIQLALFLKWHGLSGQSRWVGDPKQCIFEYAGADPALMDATIRWVHQAGGTADRLEENFRSRPELVAACNALFATAFATHGVARADVEVRAGRPAAPGLAGLAALGVWSLETRKAELDAFALAEGVRRLLAHPCATPVVDRASGATRALRAGDVAVLVATNAEAQRLADALAAHRIPVAVARSGLLDTPEGVALHAALALLADPWGERERAVLEALHGFGDRGPEAWLAARVQVTAARRAAKDRGEPAPEEPVPARGDAAEWQQRLDALRARREVLSPAETVDAALAAVDLSALCARWPDAPQRLANIDALRALAAEYEARCADLGEGASLAGLLRFFGDLQTPLFLRGEALASDAQAEARGEHAVTILTYHRSKGLEWPVVVLASLGRDGRRRPFEVAAECDEDTLDPDAPLRGRWVRYWPWPFSPSARHALGDRAASSEAGLRVTARESRERVRLLYVGFTRARDHLVLALRPGDTAWLDELRAPDGRGALALPVSAPGDGEAMLPVRILGPDGVDREVPARCWSLPAAEPEVTGRAPTFSFHRAQGAPVSGAYRVLPSEAEASGLALPALLVGGCDTLHPPLLLDALPETQWKNVGNAIHTFFATDVPGISTEERRSRARRLLACVALDDDASIGRVLEAADALRVWVQARHPGAMWRREIPVRARLEGPDGERVIVGTIDLLLELPDGTVVIVDHKSDRVGTEGGWRAQARRHAPQLAAYTLAVEATGRRVAGRFVHFAVGGGVVELTAGGAGPP